jgi:hypothetical protein
VHFLRQDVVRIAEACDSEDPAKAVVNLASEHYLDNEIGAKLAEFMLNSGRFPAAFLPMSSTSSNLLLTSRGCVPLHCTKQGSFQNTSCHAFGPRGN